MALTYNFQSTGSNGVTIKDPKASGPLQELYNSEYNLNNLFYPRNLTSDTRGHYIIFYINVAQNSQYLTGDNYVVPTFGNQSKSLDSTVVSSMGGRAGANYMASAGSTNIGVINVPLPGADNNQTIDLARKTKRIKTAIALYMPDSVNVQYGANFQDSSLTSSLGLYGAVGQNLGTVKSAWENLKSGDYSNMNSTISSVMNAIKSTGAAGFEATAQGVSMLPGMGSDIGDFIFHAAGYALNPQLEVLFKGVDLRTFQFDFVFAPHSRDEAVAVREIVQAFKFHAAPEVLPDLGKGRYLIPPSEFDIDFMYKGSKNPNIHQVGTCVLKNVSVDYAPNGWATFGGEDTDAGFDGGAGAPVQTKLSLTFQETEIVTKQRILEGY